MVMRVIDDSHYFLYNFKNGQSNGKEKTTNDSCVTDQ